MEVPPEGGETAGAPQGSRAEDVAGGQTCSTAAGHQGTEEWAVSYEVQPASLAYSRSDASAVAVQHADVVGGGSRQSGVVSQAPQVHGTGQPTSLSAGGYRITMPGSADDQQQATHFYTGDIADAYDEALNFWNFLDKELEPKDIKLEPLSPPWPEADSTSCAPYVSTTCASLSVTEYHHVLRSMTSDAEEAPPSSSYYELQPPPTAAKERVRSATCWPMDLSPRATESHPFQYSLPTAPPRFHSAGDWGQQQLPPFGTVRFPAEACRFSSAHVQDYGFEAVALHLDPNQQEPQQEAAASPLASDPAEPPSLQPLSPTGAFLKRFPYVGSREESLAATQPARLATPLPAAAAGSARVASTEPPICRIAYYYGSSTEESGQSANVAPPPERSFSGAPPAPMPQVAQLALPTTAPKPQQQQQQATVALYPRLRGLLDRQHPQAPQMSGIHQQQQQAATATAVVAFNAAAMGGPGSAGTSRLPATPVYYNAFLQPLPTAGEVVLPRSAGPSVASSSSALSSPSAQAVLPQGQPRFPKPNLTLLLTPTLSHAPRPGSTLGAPAMLHHFTQPPAAASSGQLRHHVLLAPPSAGHFGVRGPPAQASTSTMPADSATKPRRTNTDHSYPAVKYLLHSLKIGPFFLEAGDLYINLGYKFKIIFSKRRFMYEFESQTSQEDAVMRVSCVIVPFQAIQAMRCEQDYILIQVHARPVLFLGRRTASAASRNAGANTTTASLSESLEHYPVHKVQLNAGDVVRVRHMLWQFNARFHELMLRNMADADSRLEESLPPYGAPGRSAWRNEVARGSGGIRATRKAPSSRRRSVTTRKKVATEVGDSAPSNGAAASRGPAGEPAAGSSPPQPSCACRVSCRMARCSCAKARTRCEPGRCSCLGCDNPLNLLEAVGIALKDAQADPCLMQAIFQVSDLPWYLVQHVRLNCCPDSVMVRECIPGPLACPRCRQPVQYSWCTNTLFHGSTNHCSTCQRCNLFAGRHCKPCNSCYYYTGKDDECPQCRRKQEGKTAKGKVATASSTQRAAIPTLVEAPTQMTTEPLEVTPMPSPPALQSTGHSEQQAIPEKKARRKARSSETVSCADDDVVSVGKGEADQSEALEPSLVNETGMDVAPNDNEPSESDIPPKLVVDC
ncbi:uncharacterized protein LOC144145129 isoform X1 [Haemaphysalis longicornis]